MPNSEWKLRGIKDIEPNAWDALVSTSNTLIVAGPGAGKTELLAQRAAYLLETENCPEPRRILAISFKRDAAANLLSRVQLRCSTTISWRFESHTFDSFAKNLVDRFRLALPTAFIPPAEFDIAVNKAQISRLETEIGRFLRRLSPPANFSRAETLRRGRGEYFLKNVLCRSGLDDLSINDDAESWAVPQVWRLLIDRQDSLLTFDMIKRLAQLAIRKNPLLLKALRLTYSHVFVDEFQDTTRIQFDLLMDCFLRSPTVLTVVGDDKQRIMMWAGAMREVFTTFEQDFCAARVHLVMNYRADVNLVEIQRSLTAALDPNCQLPLAADHNKVGTGLCEILSFDTCSTEANVLGVMIKRLCLEGVPANQICLLSRVTPEIYVGHIIEELKKRGVRARLEDRYQDLLKEEIVQIILDVTHLATCSQAPETYERVCALISSLRGRSSHAAIDYTSEEEVDSFLSSLKIRMNNIPQSRSEARIVVDEILRFLGGSHVVRANLPQYRNNRTYQTTMLSFMELLWKSCQKGETWADALDDFKGVNSIPVMTIHKSKGLEYHAVFFIGLEDQAWARFREMDDEERYAFFVAFSRAKQRVYFTVCGERLSAPTPGPQLRTRVTSLYGLLEQAGVVTQQFESPLV
jgi:superfamily I DNA/RNA helicase